MKLLIENIGKIQKADIELNGITVIAGQNNTGKSTVGKSLFCFFNSCYKIDEKLRSNMTLKIREDLIDLVRSHFSPDKTTYHQDIFNAMHAIYHLKSIFTLSKVNKLLANIYESPNQILEKVTDFISANISAKTLEYMDSVENLCFECADKILKTLNVPTSTYKTTSVRTYFNHTFDNQVMNISENIGQISTTIKNKKSRIIFDSSGCSNLELDLIINNCAYFIDSPDGYRDYEAFESIISLNEMLNRTNRQNTVDIERAIVEKKLDNIFSVLNETMSGNFCKSESNKIDSFLFSETGKSIKLKNLSTGVRSFLLLKTMLEKRVLKEKDILILDEPEIHLHPEWQLLYAKAIVLLQKEFDLTVLLTSHSPMFIRAIECYCDLHDRMDVLDIYKTKSIDGTYNYTLENLSYSEYGVTELYEELSIPYEILDDLIKEKYTNED